MPSALALAKSSGTNTTAQEALGRVALAIGSLHAHGSLRHFLGATGSKQGVYPHVFPGPDRCVCPQSVPG